MEDERVKVIVNEIHYWKKHRLLPDVYCDFLLTLYTYGEGHHSKPMKQRFWGLFPIYLSLLTPLVPLSIVVIYFTRFPLIMQTVILSGFVVLSLFIYLFFHKHRYQYTYIALLTLLILILLLNLLLVEVIFELAAIKNVTVLINFSIWLTIAFKKKLKYLKIISILALIFTIFYSVFEIL